MNKGRYYDLPAMIDYTLNVTDYNKLRYIGYSQGTTIFWVISSERPEYMDKIDLMIAMSPDAYNSHMKSPLMRFLAPLGGLLLRSAKLQELFSRYFGVHEVGFVNIKGIHYAQEVITEKFRMFDYGAVENKKRYRSSEPSDYDLNKVTAPVLLVFSDEDWLVNPIDVAKLRLLRKQLPNVVDSYKIPNKNFNHMDCIIAKDVKFFVYERVI